MEIIVQVLEGLAQLPIKVSKRKIGEALAIRLIRDKRPANDAKRFPGRERVSKLGARIQRSRCPKRSPITTVSLGEEVLVPLKENINTALGAHFDDSVDHVEVGLIVHPLQWLCTSP